MQYERAVTNLSKNAVLNEIYDNPGLSRVELSKIFNTNRATMSNIINEMLDENILLEVGEGKSTSKGGRKPIQLGINYDYGLCIGIDISSNYISYCLANLNFKVISHKIITVDINKNNVLNLVKDIIEKNKDIYKNYEAGLIGVTIAIHGIVNNSKIIFTPNYNIDEVDLVKNLKDIYPNIRIDLINESNASALCEMIKNDIKDLVCINIGVGVGAGIVINNKLFTGENGYAGEIGHMIIFPNGKQCKCGNKGCFEQYCSEVATVDYYNSISNQKIKSISDVIKLYMSKDECAIKTINHDTDCMALLINNIMKTIAPKTIIINSSLAYNIPPYISNVIKKIKNTHNQKIQISSSVFNKKSVILGSVYNSITLFLSCN